MQITRSLIDTAKGPGRLVHRRRLHRLRRRRAAGVAGDPGLASYRRLPGAYERHRPAGTFPGTSDDETISQEVRDAASDHHDIKRTELAALQPRSQSRLPGLHFGHHRYRPGTGRMAGDSIQAQTRQALANCEAILREAGATLDDVVEVGVLLTDPGDFAGMNEEYARWFPSDPPTRYAAKLGAEIPGLLVSIRMTACLA